jgi:hypothetical protein
MGTMILNEVTAELNRMGVGFEYINEMLNETNGHVVNGVNVVETEGLQEWCYKLNGNYFIWNLLASNVCTTIC